MKVLHKKDWDYIVFEEDNEIYIEVLCGSSAMYSVKVVLSDDDKILIEKDFKYLENLSQKIRNNPKQYSEQKS